MTAIERQSDRDDRDGGGPGSGDRPTIVLVHGAFAGPSCWDQAAGILQEGGHRTVAPALDQISLSGDAAIIDAALDRIVGTKVLVAHSYGGAVISNAASGRSDVLALVYTAGVVPEETESAFSVQNGYRHSAVIDHLVFDPHPFAFIDTAFFQALFCQDLNREQAAALDRGQRPTSLEALNEPSGPVAWHTLPSWYAISGQDLVIDPAEQAFMAERAGSTVVRLDNASHAGGFTRYARDFVALVEQAVATVAQPV
jgi:pimeloyl-ACP methyl ester carboxylesterase